MIIGPANGFTPRPYQDHCINGGDPRRGVGIMRALARYKRALAVLATGLGKTELFLALVRRYLESTLTPPDKRVLVLAHRIELVDQPISRAHRFGLKFAREQGDETGVGKPERAIASTIQTMRVRKELYRPDEIGLIVIDEGHHAAAADYQDLLKYFPDAFVLGVTATPHRLDGIGLSEVYKATAFSYPVLEAIDEGWLVPVKPWREVIEGLDLSQLRTRAGDLEPGALGELMAEYAHPVARHIVERAGDRPTIVFCSTVAHAYAQAEALRRYTDARVECVDASTAKEKKGKRSKQQALVAEDAPRTRESIVQDFRDGKIQYLVNCALFTEGFDAPNARCVALVRPTKSPALMVQMIGRGTRPLPGVVDRPELAHDMGARLAAIAASDKPDVLVLDFSGVTEKHSLVGVVDALAGNLSAAERMALASVEIVGDRTVDQLLQQARIDAAEEATRKAAELAELAAHSYEVDPYHPVVAMRMQGLKDDPNEKRASEKMAKYLARNGVENAATLSFSTARKLQGMIIIRQQHHLSTISQSIALQRAGVPSTSTISMSVYVASQLMAELHQNRGIRPKRWDADPLLGGLKA